MRILGILLIVIFISSTFLITSCGEDVECEASSDCATGNPCIIGRCKDGSCVNNIETNCCGNAVCETDYGENKCLCPKDCGKCEGKVKYNVSTYRGPKEVEAEYAQFLCEGKVCIIGVSSENVNVLRITNEVDVRTGFKAEILTTLNSPYDITKDEVSIRVQLKDKDTDVIGSISITGIQILSGSELMGEKITNQKLNAVGDMFTETLTLTSAQSLVEEEKKIEVKIDYEYVELYREEQITKRDDSKNRLTQEVIFIKG